MSSNLPKLVRELLIALGEDPQREGLKSTPQRVGEALTFLTRGYLEDPKTLIANAVFSEEYDEMVLLKDIPVYSLCEHHLLPFFGKAHVGYIPDRRIVGISKIAKMVDIFAKRLQVQERLTQQIAQTLMTVLKPKGVGVVISARHLCLEMRGEEKHQTSIITSTMLGSFRARPETRAEFMQLIR